MNKYAQKMIELGAKQVGIHDGYIFPPISEEKMMEVERDLGALLPPDYREFVRDYGFYSVQDPIFSIQRNSRLYEGTIESFRGIAQHLSYQDLDIVRYTDGMSEDIEEWYPDWLNIATAGSIMMIALAISGHDYGKVFHFDNSTGESYLVAESFDEFMNLLQPNSE